jgi:hypothetical protein
MKLALIELTRGHRGRDRMVVDLLPVQSVPITTKVVSLNPVHGERYSIQHYVIKFDSDISQCTEKIINIIGKLDTLYV